MINPNSLVPQKIKDRFILDRFREAQALVYLLQSYIENEEETAVTWGLSALDGVLDNLYKEIIQITKEQALEEMNHE